MLEQNRWLEMITADPDHSHRYIERFEKMEEEGRDLGGEVRFVDVMVERNSRILDAGCGPGRVGGRLHQLGHTVVGVDLDPVLIAAAEEKFPGPLWRTADLAQSDLRAPPIGGEFDLIVSAGNVVRFLAPSERVPVLGNLADALAERGRVVIGFGSGGGEYPTDAFLDDVETVGLEVDATFATWDLRPFTTSTDFMVAVLSRP